MEILQIILFKYLLGFVLQAFMIVLGIYAFNRRVIEIKKYLITSVFLVVIFYIARLLPVVPGVHTIIDLICAFLFGILYLKMPMLTTIRSILVITVLLLLTESLDMLVMSSVLGQDEFNRIMSGNGVDKALVGLPASISFAILNLISYFIFKKKSDNNGEDGA